MRVAAIVVALMLVVCAPAMALEETFVDVTVNGVASDPTRIAFDGDDVWYPVAALVALHVPVGSLPTTEVLGLPFVELSALKGKVAFTFDPDMLTIALTLDPSLLQQHMLDLRSTAPADLVRGFTRGVVLNYSADAGLNQAAAFSLEQRASLWPNIVLENDFGRTTNGLVTRGYTDVIVDRPSSTQRITIGDTIVNAGDLGGQALVGGITVERVFGSDPYATTFPLPELQATVSQPSVADVYVNGHLVRSIDLAPGLYDLQNLPLDTGRVNAQVVLRNDFGEQTLYDDSTYQSDGLLSKGLTDYSFGAGLRRVDPEELDDHYAGLVAAGRYRMGISNTTTLGATAVFDHDTEELGVEVDHTLRFGTLHAALALSGGPGNGGHTATLGFSHQGRLSSFSIIGEMNSTNFTSLNESDSLTPQIFQLGATFNQTIDARTGVAVALDGARWLGMGDRLTPRISLDRSAGPFTGTLSYVGGIGHGFEFVITQSVRNDSNSMTAQTGTSAEFVTEHQHSASSQLGDSYDIQSTAGTAPGTSIAMQLGLPVAVVRAQGSSQQDGPAALNIDAEGALVFDHSGVYFSQPVSDAYAVVQTGIPGAQVLLDGQVVGRTNRAGNALVPSLLSYQGNRLSIATTGLKIEEMTASEDEYLAPNHLAGADAIFRSQVVHAVSGIVALDGPTGVVIPAFGELNVVENGEVEDSPIDGEGRFYLESLHTGTYVLEIEYLGAVCHAKLIVPPFEGIQFDTGKITCALPH